MTVWAYYRVSTHRQDLDAQKIGVEKYVKEKSLKIEREISDDGISGMARAEKRKLGVLMNIAKEGDIVIVSEISRLSREVFEVLRIIHTFIKKGVSVHLVKQRLIADNSPIGAIFLTVWGAAAQMERELLVERTKEGIELARLSGKTLGRPISEKMRFAKEHLEEIQQAVKEKGRTQTAEQYGLSYAGLSRVLGYLK